MAATCESASKLGQVDVLESSKPQAASREPRAASRTAVIFIEAIFAALFSARF